jgi:hypothetical protein
VKFPTCPTYAHFTANHISLSKLNVCTHNVNEINAIDKVSKADKSIYTFILAMKLDKQEQLHKFCQTVNAKCTTSMQSAPHQCKVHHVNAKCTTSMQSAPHQCKVHHISAKCTTSVMLYEQKQPPLKVRAPAMLLFRSINANMMVKINNDLTVTHVATDVIKNSPLYKAL